MKTCKMLSPDHVIVNMRILHPFFGYLAVDSFQRTRKSIDHDTKNQTIRWKGFDLSAEWGEIFESKTFVADGKTYTTQPVVFATVPYDQAPEN